MSIYQRRLQISLPWAIAIVSIALLAVFSYISVQLSDKKFFELEGPAFVFISGLVPGLAVALMQFLLSWAEFKQISHFSAMKIKGVLNSRDEEKYYHDLLEKAQTRIDVLGVTSSRFMRDFADEGSNRKDKKVLIEALARGAHVRILVPEIAHLSLEDANYKYPVAEQAFRGLRTRFPRQFEVKYFAHTPIASIVCVDEDVLVGPVFQNRESRNTPAVHTSIGSALAKSYLNHFEDEWSRARPL